MKKIIAILTVVTIIGCLFCLVACNENVYEVSDNSNTYETENDIETETDDMPAGQPVHRHVYSKTVIKPTCISEGYSEYKCECGNSYIDDRVKESNHIGIGYCEHCNLCFNEAISKYFGNEKNTKTSSNKTIIRYPYKYDEETKSIYINTECQYTTDYFMVKLELKEDASWSWEFDYHIGGFMSQDIVITGEINRDRLSELKSTTIGVPVKTYTVADSGIINTTRELVAEEIHHAIAILSIYMVGERLSLDNYGLINYNK